MKNDVYQAFTTSQKMPIQKRRKEDKKKLYIIITTPPLGGSAETKI